jgi:hypothetical protein
MPGEGDELDEDEDEEDGGSGRSGTKEAASAKCIRALWRKTATGGSADPVEERRRWELNGTEIRQAIPVAPVGHSTCG